MSDLKFNFDDNFQLGVFELMMADSAFCDKAVALLKPEFFKNEYYSWFFRKLKDLKAESNEHPTHLQLRNEIVQINPKDQEVYLKLYNRIIQPQLARDHSYIKKQLTKFAKKAIAYQINDRIVRGQHKDPDKILSEIQEEFNRFENASFDSVKTQKLGALSTIMEKSAEQANDLIPTYMPTIDRELLGGVPRQTLTVALSGTNVGKSIWMVNWAWQLLKNGYKVFMVILEGHEYQPMLRIASRALGISYRKIRFNDLNDVERRKVEEFEKKYQDKIEIFYDSSFDFTIEDMVPILRQKKKDMGMDVVMVDYGQILKTSQKFDAERHRLSYVHRGLSSLAGELDVAMVTVAQGNRETQEKIKKSTGLVRMGDIAECFEIVRASATILTLNRSEEDELSERMRVLLDKQRDGRTNIVEICKTDMSRIAIYGDEEEGLGFMSYEEYLQETS